MKTQLTKLALNLTLASALCTLCQAEEKSEPVEIIGVWEVVAKSEESERSLTWTFEKSGGAISGVSKSHDSGNERKFDRITTSGNKVTLEIDFERDGNNGIIKVAAEQTAAGTLAGKWSIEGADGTVYRSGEVNAKKENKTSLAGKWRSKSVLEDGRLMESDLILKAGENGLEGSFKGDDGNSLEIDKIKADGESIRLEFDWEIEPGNSIDLVIEGRLQDGNKLVGNWIVKDGDGAEAAKGDWSAARAQPDLAGTWAVTAARPDGGEYKGTLTLTREGDDYSGKSKSEDGNEIDLTSVSVAGGKLDFSVAMERDGEKSTISVKAERSASGALVGMWSLTDADGAVVAGDAWKAVQEK